MYLIDVLPLIIAAATTGLACGMACGACGNPMINVFLASYLFTHSGRLKQSVVSFAGFYAGKVAAVVFLCVIAAWLGSRIVDDSGLLFGFNMHALVRFLMFSFALFLTGKWIWRTVRKPQEAQHVTPCESHGGKHTNTKRRKLPLIVCGFISGAAPCAPLIMAIGYAATLSVAHAAVMGVVFSVASSLLPLLVLVVLTGLLSAAMFSEIPHKVRYFQLGSYVLIAAVSGHALIQTM